MEPSSIVLVPNASFQLRWRGGPKSGAKREFTSSDPTVVSVVGSNETGSLGVITAHAQGEAIVTGQLYHNNGKKRTIGREQSVRVVVKLLDGLDIRVKRAGQVYGWSAELIEGEEVSARSIIGLLVAGCWSLVAGRWSLVAGYWLLVAGCLLVSQWSFDC
jgi:hypothetical protein